MDVIDLLLEELSYFEKINPLFAKRIRNSLNQDQYFLYSYFLEIAD